MGTGFLVSVPSNKPPVFLHAYVVTATHVVQPYPVTLVRLRVSPSEFVDVPVPQWEHHHAADVSVAPLRPVRAKLTRRPITVTIESERFVGSGDVMGWEPELGERVYFLGLFDRFREMGERNIPLTRSGSVAAFYVQDVPIGPPDNLRHVEAHLIDCRSYAGFSGSPCFVQRDMWEPSWFAEGGTHVDDESGRIHTETALLGIVSGHFDTWGTARLTGDLPMEPGAVEVPLNTGVGVVTPAKAIKEMLEMKELADDRARVEDETEKRVKGDEGATLDASQESEFDRFERLTRELVNTPKQTESDES